MTTDAATDYPQLFRRMVVRSTEAALATIDPKAAKLEEEERERSLYALGLALDLPDAWLVTKDLLIAISPQMGRQGYREDWMTFLEKGLLCAERQADSTTLAKLHVQLGWFYRLLNQFDLANYYLLHGYELALQNDDRATQIDALDQLSLAGVECSNFAVAKTYLDKLFDIAAADDPRRAHSCSRLGFIALQQGDWDNAIYWYTESRRLHAAAGQAHFVAQATQNLAFVCTCNGQYQQAIAYYQYALQVFNQNASIVDTAKTQMELGVAYWYLEDYSQALSLFECCEPVFVKTGDKVSLAHLYNNRGLAYQKLGQFERAERSFSTSIELSRELNQPRLIANAMESLGGMFVEMKMLDKAIAAWEQGLAELAALLEPPQRLYNLLMRRIQEVKHIQGNPPPNFP